MPKQNKETALARWIVRNMAKCPFEGAHVINPGACRGFKEKNCPECVRANAGRLLAPDAASAMAEWIRRHAACCPLPCGEDDEALGRDCVGFGEDGCASCILEHAGMLDSPSDKLGNDMSGLKPGDYVVYQNGSRIEIGRVKRLDFKNRKAWVWYSKGDTASCTRFEDLIRPANGYVGISSDLGGSDAEAMFGGGQ